MIFFLFGDCKEVGVGDEDVEERDKQQMPQAPAAR